MDEPLRNPRTGQVVTRIVTARHRDATRDVVLLRTGAVITITCHNYDPTLHGPLDTVIEVADLPADDVRPATKSRKRATKKKR